MRSVIRQGVRHKEIEAFGWISHQGAYSTASATFATVVHKGSSKFLAIASAPSMAAPRLAAIVLFRSFNST
jgi:hypothetical protein